MALGKVLRPLMIDFDEDEDDKYKKSNNTSLVGRCVEYINHNYKKYLRQIQNNLDKDTLGKLMETLVQGNKRFIEESVKLDRGFTPSYIPLYSLINKVVTRCKKTEIRKKPIQNI
jgi:hypothetical protein